jgi:hypothetical protein
MTLDLDHPQRPSIVEAQTAARAFLTAALPEVERVDITRLAPISGSETAWEAEADVWQPNLTLRSLGIHTERPVLDHSRYSLQLDALLNVLAFELEGSADGR